MKFRGKIWITDDEGKKSFGKGIFYILKKIDETGSLNKACKELEMSYSKAFKMIKEAEEILGEDLTEVQVGGVSGGGSTLTENAKKYMKIFDEAEEKVEELLDELGKRKLNESFKE